jgi:hypothetical protein
LKVGPITLVEIVLDAESTRSGSIRIFGRFGAIEARIPTTSSDLAIGLPMESLSAAFSENPIGRVVKVAVRSRRNKSCEKTD